jgi:hypothetical protein
MGHVAMHAVDGPIVAGPGCGGPRPTPSSTMHRHHPGMGDDDTQPDIDTTAIGHVSVGHHHAGAADGRRELFAWPVRATTLQQTPAPPTMALRHSSTSSQGHAATRTACTTRATWMTPPHGSWHEAHPHSWEHGHARPRCAQTRPSHMDHAVLPCWGRRALTPSWARPTWQLSCILLVLLRRHRGHRSREPHMHTVEVRAVGWVGSERSRGLCRTASRLIIVDSFT